MARKKLSPEERITEMATKIRETIARWKNHKENGCCDPAYADGTNMNLLRNHVIGYKRQIRELCEENNIPLPDEVYLPNLPYVDNNYFAKPDSDRAKRIMSRPGWECYNHERPSI